MEFEHDREKSSPREGFWSLVGALSFSLLGLLIGAVLVYSLLAFVFVPVPEVQPPINDQNGLEVEEVPEPSPDMSVVSVVKQVMPAVVSVNRHTMVTRFGEPPAEEISRGSGVIISSEGYIVTNQHVIAGADKITVILPNQRLYEAELVGSDLLTDLALLRIDQIGLVYIPLGDSSRLQVGETVLAIGNPLGFFQQTVTTGVVSAMDRQIRIPDSEYAYTFLQTDALINPGNSGGPLVNLSGEVVGINTAKIFQPGVEGIGLSIPSNIVIRVIDDLLAHGRVLRPHLGVVVEDWLEHGEIATTRGILIREIAPGSAAEQAGLLPGDILIAVDGKAVNFLAQFFDRLFAFYPGDIVNITIIRDGQEKVIAIIPTERPS